MSRTDAPEPRRVRAVRANDWMRDGWGQFKRAPLEWLLVLLAIVVCSLLLSALPGGGVIVAIGQPVLVGAIMLGCQGGSQQSDGFGLPAMKQALASPVLGRLLQLGLLSIALQLLAMLPLAALLAYLMGSETAGSPEQMSPVLALAAMLLTLPLFAVLLALWFAPALVAVSGVKPLAAVRASLLAGWKNPLSLLLHGLWILALMLLVGLTFGLAIFIAVPLLFASVYASYEDIFDMRRRTPPGSTRREDEAEERSIGVLEA